MTRFANIRWGVLLGVSWLLFSCAKPQNPARTSRVGLPDTAHARDNIRQLNADIERWTTELGISLEPGHTAELPLTEITSPQPRCAPPADDSKCTDTCGLTTRICTAAQRICELASADHGAPWAQNQCSRGQRACQRAQKRCCDCANK